MGKHLNFVHNDEIWKDHVRHEMQSFSKKWPEKWGYLRQEYNMMNRCLAGLPPETPDTPTQGSAVLRRATEHLKLPPIKAAKAFDTKFPVTTTQLIGWKSTKPEYQLEIYGRYAPKARGQTGIFKQLNWPQQGI